MYESPSDVADWKVKATCPHCGRRWITDREVAWQADEAVSSAQAVWLADDLCSEYEPDWPRPSNEW